MRQLATEPKCNEAGMANPRPDLTLPVCLCLSSPSPPLSTPALPPPGPRRRAPPTPTTKRLTDTVLTLGAVTWPLPSGLRTRGRHTRAGLRRENPPM